MWMRLLVSVSVLTVVVHFPSYSQAAGDPLVLQADEIINQQNQGLTIARGNVEIVQGTQIVLADEIIYNKNAAKVQARGNIKYLDDQGNVYFADTLNFTRNMQDAFVQGVGILTQENARLTALSGQKIDNAYVVLDDASYSPCDVCSHDNGSPFWQINASQIVKDETAQDIIYRNVTLEFFGVPVAYAPYFRHPAPEVKRRSGLLTPSAGYDTKRGSFLRGQYYFALAPDKDLTIEAMGMRNQLPLIGGQWRQRFENGQVDVSASLTRSEILSGGNDNTVLASEDWRGHIDANGRFDLNEKWRTGFKVKRTTDDYYLEDYDYGGENVLKNNVYLERFDGRDYSRISGWYFQDLRDGKREKQPDILPWMQHTAYGEAGDTLGGRWKTNYETVSLLRSDTQSVSRVSVVPSWQRQIRSESGLSTTVDASVRADGWWVRDRFASERTSKNDADETVARIFPQLHVHSEYPLVRPMAGGHWLVSPQVALAIAPDSAVDPAIPNEDSRDIQLDIGNLFRPNRFPGVDSVESGTHIAYGMQGGYVAASGAEVLATIGRSYRMTENENLFPSGSGLENQNSDLVGQLRIAYPEYASLDYRTQISGDEYNARRHELESVVSLPATGTSLSNTYMYAETVKGTNLNAIREELETELYQDLSDEWSMKLSAVQNLSRNSDQGLRKAGADLIYANDCFSFKVSTRRNLTDRRSGGPETSVIFSIGLKTLGSFESPTFDGDIFTGGSDSGN